MTLWLAALAGLLGAGHCAGMCGGLVSACFLRLGAGGRRPTAHAVYHGGRLGIYVAAGAIAGGAGEALIQTGRLGLVSGALQVVTGLLAIALGLDVLGVLPFGGALGFAPSSWARTVGGRAFEPPAADGVASPSPGSSLRPAFLAGVANGLMPCSLTLSIAVQSAAAGSAAAGALLMAAFGAGTLPAMLSIGWLFSRVSLSTRLLLQRGAAIVVIGMGVAQAWQGLSYLRVMRKLVL